MNTTFIGILMLIAAALAFDLKSYAVATIATALGLTLIFA
jgi:hypothetical protein